MVPKSQLDLRFLADCLAEGRQDFILDREDFLFEAELVKEVVFEAGDFLFVRGEL